MKVFFAILGLAATPALAGTNHVTMTTQGDSLCFSSNGTPAHAIGQFPNPGNPNSFQAQTINVCVDATPQKTGRITEQVPVSGITLSGILIRPGTADYYDRSSPRGFSRDPSSGWRLEGMGAATMLGIDQNNAHVDNRGLYHYHKVSNGVLKTSNGSLIGYAADGYEIHYVGSGAKSSWQLKPGNRPSGPGGAYDGTYEQDWQFVKGSGNLDRCNGARIDGRYVYFATDTYPFFPRCFVGTVSPDFRRP